MNTVSDEHAFERERPRLVGIAYRMCGSFDDAEDIVQEAWFRWQRTESDAIESPPAWLTTVVTRLSIDRLRVRKRERERYVGPWLPEPLVDQPGRDPLEAVAAPSSDSPEQRAEVADSLTTTFLLMLEELSATERAALLLVDVFGESLRTASEMLGRTPVATRQMVSRARRRLRELPDTAPPHDPDERRVAEEFMVAAVAGDLDGLRSLLAQDVVALSDGGPNRRAARRPVVGAGRVSRYVANLTRRAADRAIEPVLVAGRPGLLVRADDEPEMVTWFEVAGGKVWRIHSVRNPDKLGHVEQHPPLL